MMKKDKVQEKKETIEQEKEKEEKEDEHSVTLKHLFKFECDIYTENR